MKTAFFLKESDAVALLNTPIGGKARELNWMSRRGFPVPKWGVLSSSAQSLFLNRNQLDAPLRALLKKLNTKILSPEETASAIEILFEDAVLPEEIRTELGIHLADFFGKNWQTIDYAVRSSIEDEDGARHSFAGQMDSYLFQQGLPAVEKAILRIYLSAFSERSLSYRVQHGLSLLEIRASVIIQEMIPGEVSGVIFTAHPISGSRKHALISANYGCGEGVVSGVCDCDEFTVSLLDHSIQATIAHKETYFTRASGLHSGARQLPVSAEKKDVPCLSDAQIRELTRISEEIARAKKSPQDIEWTYFAGAFHILQSRPITKLPPEASSLGNGIVFDNSNIQESYCGVTLPLTFSFASRSYFDVYRQLMKITGFAEAEIAANDRRHGQMLGLVGGRVYYHINHWYEGLLLLPSFGKNKADMEKMMGLTEPVAFVMDQKLSPREKLKRVPKLLAVAGRLIWEFTKIDRLFEAFERDFASHYAEVDRSRFIYLNGRELAGLAETLREKFLQNWGSPIINDFYVMMMNGKVSARLKKFGLAEEQMKLLAGEVLASALPTKELKALAKKVKDDPILLRTFESHPDERLFEILFEISPSFHAECEAFIERFGDRCIGELKLESISMREDPRFIFQVIRSYLKNEPRRDDLNLDLTHRPESERKLRAESEAFVRSKMGVVQWFLFSRNLNKLRKGVRYRESMRFARTRVFGIYRTLYLEMGARMQEIGAIEDKRDVFYLTVQELDDYFFGKSVQLSLKPLILQRKIEYASYEETDPGNHLSTGVPYAASAAWTKPSKSSAEKSNDGSPMLRGIGCYPGIVRKSVRLIRSPNEKMDLEGRILCTMRTDPGWTPLFASISGLLVERGSSLSHSAVVAREMGVPAIVGVPDITQFLADQEVVEMDGTLGTVRRIQRESNPT